MAVRELRMSAVLAAACLLCVSGERLPVAPPMHGFERNIGQFGEDVLFALDSRAIYRDHIQFEHGIDVGFRGANPASVISGQGSIEVPLRVYSARSADTWVRDVPHYRAVRYTNLYPGIDLEVSVQVERTIQPPALRFTVGAGAEPQQVRMTLTPATPGNQFWLAKMYNDKLAGYQIDGPERKPVLIKIVKEADDLYRLQPGAYDVSLPLIVEFGTPLISAPIIERIKIADDESVVSCGYLYGSDPKRAYLAKSTPDGTPVFLTVWNITTPAWIELGSTGAITVAARFLPEGRGMALPVTAEDAPRPAANLDAGDTWLARFDSEGALLSATFTGGSSCCYALDPGGSVYFATDRAIQKWMPGQRQFGFRTEVERVIALSAASDGVSFLANGTASQLTTPGVVGPQYEGIWTQYAGTVDRDSGQVRMATYVPIIGQEPSRFSVESSLALAPNGTFWISSRLKFSELSTVNTLVALSADGTRIFDAQGLTFAPAAIAFEADSSVMLAGPALPNLPTPADAPLREACGGAAYLLKRKPNGAIIDATYLDATGVLQVLRKFDRIYLSPTAASDAFPLDWERVEVRRPAAPRISCFISPATRGRLFTLGPGELITVAGYGLGPTETTHGSADIRGAYPLKLADVEVVVDGNPVPLIAVQQGAITFYLPEARRTGQVSVEVRRGGQSIATASTFTELNPRFALLTIDGSGKGIAAALNQDGTLNRDHGATQGSVVSLFGIGGVAPSAVFVGDQRATIEYSGSAPGLPPGVKQVNIRVPTLSSAGANDYALLRLTPAPPPFQFPSVYLRIRGVPP